jgi:hypothetical protein
MPKRRFCAAARRGRTAAPPEVGGGGNPCRIQRATRCAHVFYSQMKSIYSKTRVKVKLISRKPWEGVLGGRNALRVKLFLTLVFHTPPKRR